MALVAISWAFEDRARTRMAHGFSWWLERHWLARTNLEWKNWKKGKHGRMLYCTDCRFSHPDKEKFAELPNWGPREVGVTKKTLITSFAYTARNLQ